MKIERFKIVTRDVDAGRQTGEPFIRMSTGEGCGLPHCHCSDGYWISMSDGKVGLRVTFETKERMDEFLKAHEAVVA